MARRLTVAPVDQGRRLDRWLARLDGGLPSSLVRRLLRQRRVRVNGQRIRDAAHLLQGGDEVEIHHEFQAPATTPSETGGRKGPDPDLVPEVLMVSSDFLLIHKPAGMACSDDGQDPRALALWLRDHFAHEISEGKVRPEPCHRLDRGTTGIVAVSLNPAAANRFRVALEGGLIHKVYEVAVDGVPDNRSFTCETPLQRRADAGRTEPRMIPGDDLPACTEFELVRAHDGRSLLRAHPRTGRTHQIRAHCLALGLPVIGDPRYGNARDPNPGHQLLHARRLSLDGPDGFDIQVDWPPAEREALRELGLLP